MAIRTRPQSTSQRKSALLGGFDSLTLDPSPRLRETRDKMAQESRSTIGEAWKSTGEALASAMLSVGRTFTAQPEADSAKPSKPSKSF